MQRSHVSHQLRLAALIASVAAVGAPAAEAHRTALSVEVLSVQATLAPFGFGADYVAAALEAMSPVLRAIGEET